MPRTTAQITTRDGVCPASVFTPSTGAGPWPGIIFFMDGPGIRPALWDMGQRLADGGYVVVLPDLYYRSGPYEPMEPAKIFSDPAAREMMMSRMKILDREKKVSDAEAFIAYLASRADVTGAQFGTTGYCMGGNCSLTAAGAFPDRLAAVASFHGGNLATDSPDSPHRHIGAFPGRIYVAGAIEDGSFNDEQKQLLEKTLTDAKIDHLIETYDGAKHGWAVADVPVYNPAAAERHWNAMFALFSETLTPA
jgi:carboxymethylenebutenolidase